MSAIDIGVIRTYSTGEAAFEKPLDVGSKALLVTLDSEHIIGPPPGFRFLKNPELLADPLYLQDEKRIMALLMTVNLCLLVYSVLQWCIRQGLKETGR
jgi:transposase